MAPTRPKALCCNATAGALAALALVTGPVPVSTTSAAKPRSGWGASTLRLTDPTPEDGDQGGAQRRIIDDHIAKQRGCRPDLPPRPQAVDGDPPGFQPNVGGTGNITDADPRLGGQFRADRVNGRWHIEYPFC